MKKPLIGIGSDVVSSVGERDRAVTFLTYVEALKRAGALPVLIPPQSEEAGAVLARLDGLLLAGGNDCDPSAYGEACNGTVDPMDTRRQGNDFALAKAARLLGVPTLGICLGMQVINIAAGGSLIQDIPTQYETSIEHSGDPSARARHMVVIDTNSRLGNIIGVTEVEVNSSHHQAARKVGEGLVVTAKAPDGIVEGLEDPSHPFYVGVQWHPEDMTGEASADALFAAFVSAARSGADARAAESAAAAVPVSE